MDEFIARSASDKTEDWPFWFVARKSNPGRNVLREACEIAGIEFKSGAVLTFKEDAIYIEQKANERLTTR